MPLEYGAYSYKLAVAATLHSLIGSLAAVELVKIESSAHTHTLCGKLILAIL